MKLLIVDDEELTRTGLMYSFNWKAHHIDEILQADDGINGLHTALSEHPDIILCDIRMPRMDGIDMLEKIRSTLPNIPVIFMSGYSDKAYFKAAIKLKAIQYIEKPINMSELESALENAIKECKHYDYQKTVETIYVDQAIKELASLLTTPYSYSKQTIYSLCLECNINYLLEKLHYITALIVRLDHPTEDHLLLSNFYQSLHTFLAPLQLDVIYTSKKIPSIIYYIYGSSSPTTHAKEQFTHYIQSYFSSLYSSYISVGETVAGIENAYSSYTSAVLSLQSSFFFSPGTILTQNLLTPSETSNKSMLISLAFRYKQALKNKKYDSLSLILDALSDYCTENTSLLESQVKSTYYELLIHLHTYQQHYKLGVDLPLENSENIMELMSSFFSFSELHQCLVQKTNYFLKEMNTLISIHPTILTMREYISRHYQDPQLSVKAISDYAALSTSYACTLFKAETGTTLNQFITEYRMEKAKQLLADSRYKVNDICLQVGYNDSNYFGKSFKKYCGLSPSEYRNGVLNL